MRKLCLSGFRLVTLVWWRHHLPYMTLSTKTDNMSQRQRSAPVWQFSNKECLLCQKRPKDSGGEIHRICRNMALSIIQETIKTWWSTFIEGHVDIVVDNVTMTWDCILLKCSTISTQWTSRYSWSESVAESTTAATSSRSDIHDVTDRWWRYTVINYIETVTIVVCLLK